MQRSILSVLFCLFFSIYALLFANNPRVLMQTSQGDIILELNQTKAPITVQNFLDYVDEGFYDGTIFHRVIPNFMIQGGGMTDELKLKDTKPDILNEADNGLSNDKYTISMARTSMGPHTASSQFFINTQDNLFLNFKNKTSERTWGYAVFGKVLPESYDTVQKISSLSTKTIGYYQSVPIETVKIIQVKRL